MARRRGDPATTDNDRELHSRSCLSSIDRRNIEIRSRAQIQADDDFRAICRKIVGEERSVAEWDRIESDDMFQQGAFIGGYDACEQEFTFSYYDASKKEWWLSFSLPIAEKIARGDEHWLDLFEPV